MPQMQLIIQAQLRPIGMSSSRRGRSLTRKLSVGGLVIKPTGTSHHQNCSQHGPHG
jgi:hypothetical protein